MLADGRRMPAAVRGSDPESDLAVLKIDAKNLPVITFGKLENIQVGDTVLAIGSPFGFGSSVTHGIVSALGRSHLGINRFEDFIQTDAAVNPGNSGGALVDSSGNLVGINSAIFSQSGGSQGIGFAIPVSLAKTVLEQIIKDGEVTRGWLGIEPQDITPEVATAFALAKSDGVLIRGVLKSGPADRAGMQVRDVVVDIDGKPTHDVTSLLAQIAALTPGTQAKLRVMREPKAGRHRRDRRQATEAARLAARPVPTRALFPGRSRRRRAWARRRSARPAAPSRTAATAAPPSSAATGYRAA